MGANRLIERRKERERERERGGREREEERERGCERESKEQERIWVCLFKARFFSSWLVQGSF